MEIAIENISIRPEDSLQLYINEPEINEPEDSL
jgi:hypothetical protein